MVRQLGVGCRTIESSTLLPHIQRQGAGGQASYLVHRHVSGAPGVLTPLPTQVGTQLRARLEGKWALLGTSPVPRQIFSGPRAHTAAVTAAAASQADSEYRTVQAYLVEAGCLQMGAPGVVELVKSPKDQRLYRRLTLPNGIGVLVISDPYMSDEALRAEVRPVSTRRQMSTSPLPEVARFTRRSGAPDAGVGGGG